MAKWASRTDLLNGKTGETVELEVGLEVEDADTTKLTFKVEVEGDEIIEVGTTDPEKIDMFFEEMDALRDKWMASGASSL